MKRVLLTLGASGFAALVLATALPPTIGIGLSLFCLVAGVFALCLPSVRRHSRAYAAGLLAAGVALCLFEAKEISDYRTVTALAGQTVWIEAEITDTPSVSGDQLTSEVRVLSGDLKPGTRLFYGMSWEDEPPLVGAIVTGTVWLSEADRTISEPMSFIRGKATGIYLTAWPQSDGSTAIAPADPNAERDWAWRLSARLRNLRESVNTALTDGLPSDARAVVSAVCLGRRSGLTGEVVDSFRQSGVSHLLVVSGLHVSFVAMGLYAALRRLKVRRRTASIVALIGLVLFACLVGWHASVVRSCVLIASLLLGRCFRRPADNLNSLGGGLLVLWLFDPFCVYDLGLWLSFGATIGLIFLFPWMWRHLSKTRLLSRTDSLWAIYLRGAAKVVCVSLSASLPTCPLVAFFYGEVSLVSPLTNLLTVWVAALLLYLSALTGLFSAIGLGFAVNVLAVPTAALTRYLLWVTRTLSGWSGAVWNTRSPYVQVWILGTGLLLWLGWRLWRGRGFRMAAALCVIILCAGTLLHTVRMQGVTTLTAYNRYGHVAVAAQKDGRTVVAVSGRPQSWKAARRLLDACGVLTADEVIVTDPTCYPAGEWADFDTRVSVGRYWLTSLEPDTAARLLNGRAPVSLVPADPAFGEWRWDADTKTLNMTFGDSRVALCASPADFEETIQPDTLTLAMTVHAWQELTDADDTPVSGRRQAWYTRGQGWQT